MRSYQISELIDEKITGEWGDDPVGEDDVAVIRTANFTNLGTIDYSKVVFRNVARKKIAAKRLKSGDVIIEKSGGSPTQPVGRVVIFERETPEVFLCNNFTTALRPKRDLVFPKYFLYSLSQLYRTGRVLRHQNKTTGIINLKLDSYLEEKVNLPPLDDQKRITHLLGKVEGLIAQRKQHLQQLDALLKSVFLEMFGDIRCQKSKYPLIPFRPYLKASSGKSSKEVLSSSDTGIPVFGGNGVNGWAAQSLYEAPVVIAGRVGQQCGVIHVSRGPCWVTDNAIVLIIDNREMLNITYLAEAFQIAPIRERVKQLDLPFINQSMLLDYPLPLPPLHLQNKFATIVEKVEAIKSRYQHSLADLEALYAALSQKAFAGELDLSRVPAQGLEG